MELVPDGGNQQILALRSVRTIPSRSGVYHLKMLQKKTLELCAVFSGEIMNFILNTSDSIVSRS